MEAEVRAILTDAVREPEREDGLIPALMARFAELGGVELDLPPRRGRVRVVDFPE